LSEKVESKNTGLEKNLPVYFKCKFCGETKPFEELVVLRQYYPQVSVCKACSIAVSNAK